MYALGLMMAKREGYISSGFIYWSLRKGHSHGSFARPLSFYIPTLLSLWLLARALRRASREVEYSLQAMYIRWTEQTHFHELGNYSWRESRGTSLGERRNILVTNLSSPNFSNKNEGGLLTGFDLSPNTPRNSKKYEWWIHFECCGGVCWCRRWKCVNSEITEDTLAHYIHLRTAEPSRDNWKIILYDSTYIMNLLEPAREVGRESHRSSRKIFLFQQGEGQD